MPRMSAKTRKAFDRPVRKGSDEAAYLVMLKHAAINWAMTVCEKDWHGYMAPGTPAIGWFDADGTFLGYTGLTPD